jgi:chromate transporter
VTGFGGPAAHIALMRRELVERRSWLTDAEMIDLIGLTSVIPGPNSTELAMLIGRRRAGTAGLLVAGLAFIVPAALIVTALAWLYVTSREAPQVDALLAGVKPVIVVIIVAALVAFARDLIRSPLAVLVALGAAATWGLLGINELLLLALGAVAVVVLRGLWSPSSVVAVLPPWLAGGTLAASSGVDLALLAAVFLKAGALLFGSGYVLVAFLEGDLVHRLGWLTQAQLLDAIAIGQVTPGPLFTTATFIGYLLLGIPGAVVATAAIFAPAFVLAGLVAVVADRVRHLPLTAALLDGLNAAALGLLAAVSVELARTAIVDVPSALIAVGAAIGLWFLRLPSVLLVAAGATVGLALAAAGAPI